jgi:hypothetical protein
MIMNRIVLSPFRFGFGAGLPAGFDRLNRALLARRTKLREIDTSNDLFLAAPAVVDRIVGGGPEIEIDSWRPSRALDNLPMLIACSVRPQMPRGLAC